MIGRAITSYPLGLIGDKYGRKFVLVFTSLVAGFGSLLFGLSTSYKMAFIIRFIMGKVQYISFFHVVAQSGLCKLMLTRNFSHTHTHTHSMSTLLNPLS